MGHTEADIPLYIAQGGCSNTTARVMGDVFTLGPCAVDFLNIPHTFTTERLLGALVDIGLQLQGFRNLSMPEPRFSEWAFQTSNYAVRQS